MTTRKQERAGPLERQLRANLEARRKALNITQVQLADLLAESNLRLPQQTIAKIESGERSLGIDEAAHIAHALGTTFHTMIRSARPSTISTLRTHLRLSKQELVEHERNLVLIEQEYAEAKRAADDLGEIVVSMRLRRIMRREDIAALTAEIEAMQSKPDARKGRQRGEHQTKA